MILQTKQGGRLDMKNMKRLAELAGKLDAKGLTAEADTIEFSKKRLVKTLISIRLHCSVENVARRLAKISRQRARRLQNRMMSTATIPTSFPKGHTPMAAEKPIRQLTAINARSFLRILSPAMGKHTYKKLRKKEPSQPSGKNATTTSSKKNNCTGAGAPVL